MSGVIASVVGTARGSSAIAPTINYWPGPTLTYCGAYWYQEAYTIWYLVYGTAPISWTIYRDGSVATSGTIGGSTFVQQWVGHSVYDTYHTNGIGCFNLYASNAAGSVQSQNTKTVAAACYEDCFCTDYPGGPYNGASWGCYNCSEVYNCPACEYDCSCDNAFGFGTYGCNCGPEDQDCAWCYPNCPYGQSWCPSWTYCPCGDSCSYGDTWCEAYMWDPNYFGTPTTC